MNSFNTTSELNPKSTFFLVGFYNLFFNRNLIHLTFKFIAIVLLLSGCNSSSKNKTADLREAKKAIQESNAIYFDSFKNNDPSLFIDRYAEDASILLPERTANLWKRRCSQIFQKSL